MTLSLPSLRLGLETSFWGLRVPRFVWVLLIEEGDKLLGSFAFEVLKGFLSLVLFGRVAFLLNEVPNLPTGLYRVLDFLNQVFAFNGRCLPQDLVRVRPGLNASAVRFYEGYMERVIDSLAFRQGQPDGHRKDDFGNLERSQHLVVELLGRSLSLDVAGVEYNELVFDEGGSVCLPNVCILLYAGAGMFKVGGSLGMYRGYLVGVDLAGRVKSMRAFFG